MFGMFSCWCFVLAQIVISRIKIQTFRDVRFIFVRRMSFTLGQYAHTSWSQYFCEFGVMLYRSGRSITVPRGRTLCLAALMHRWTFGVTFRRSLRMPRRRLLTRMQSVNRHYRIWCSVRIIARYVFLFIAAESGNSLSQFRAIVDSALVGIA